jgi:hypothetical protein
MCIGTTAQPFSWKNQEALLRRTLAELALCADIAASDSGQGRQSAPLLVAPYREHSLCNRRHRGSLHVRRVRLLVRVAQRSRQRGVVEWMPSLKH